MFVREGLLDPLSGALLNVMGNGNEGETEKKGQRHSAEGSLGSGEWREENSGESVDSVDSADLEGGMKIKIIKILLVFSQVSQSDLHVRNAVGTRKVIRSESSSSFSVLLLTGFV
jgi:hypothetical protein